MKTIEIINFIITIVFIVCYSYQFFYVAVPFLWKDKPHKKATPHRYAVLISARNEAAVIENLISSIRAQSYDASLVSIFVVADNCDDATADTARAAGATVFERFDTAHIGKGYALEFLIDRIYELYPEKPFDAFFVFDADNVLDEGYIEAMNRTFSDGYRIVTSYRNSKNFGDNWISAGYALWFMRESRFLNHSRMLLGTSCAVSGTGFMFAREIIEKTGGWKFHLLIEDIEFTVHQVMDGEKIGFCRDAMIYDEQPVKFRQSWNQRKRWSRGYLQVLRKSGGGLIRGMFRGSFSCYDMGMNIMPAAVLSIAGICTNVAAIVASIIAGQGIGTVIMSALSLLLDAYLTVFILGAITTATEWKHICAPTRKKLLYALTFPIFMMTYIPVFFAAIFDRHVGWQPIEHNVSKTLADIRRDRSAA